VADGGWVNKATVAAHLSVSQRTVERYMRRGLPYVKLYDGGAVRFRIAAVDAWLATSTDGRSGSGGDASAGKLV
jgi:excisionase family DNA binding protein